MAEFGNAGSLLKDLPPLAAFGREDLVDLSLADDGVALLAHAGIQEQFRHVLQPDGLAVDVVFALPAAVVPAGDGHLGFLHGRENPGSIVQHQRHLGKTHLGPLLRAAENHVLHLGAPEAFGALLAHDPADGVGDIGFSRTVGPHNGGNVLAELEDGFVGEGFETLNFYCF